MSFSLKRFPSKTQLAPDGEEHSALDGSTKWNGTCGLVSYSYREISELQPTTKLDEDVYWIQHVLAEF